jgi:hypothetical protein
MGRHLFNAESNEIRARQRKTRVLHRKLMGCLSSWRTSSVIPGSITCLMSLRRIAEGSQSPCETLELRFSGVVRGSPETPCFDW